VGFAIVVAFERARLRGRTLLMKAFVPVAAKRMWKHPQTRFCGLSAFRTPETSASVLVGLRAFREAVDVLAYAGAAARSLELSIVLSRAMFELGEFVEALEVLQAWSGEVQIAGHDVLQETLAYLRLINGQEHSAGQLLTAAATGMPHLFRPHQNMAARSRSGYMPTPLDIEAEGAGRLYDAYNYIGQRVTHVGAGHLSADLFAGAFRAQEVLRLSPPTISRELVDWFDLHNISLYDLRLLPVEWVTQIGHLGMLDILFRMRKLGWWAGDAVLVAPAQAVANASVVSLFEGEVRILTSNSGLSETAAAEVDCLQRFCGLSLNAFKLPGGQIVPWQEAGALAMRQWEQEQRPDPLRSEFDRRFGSLHRVVEAVERIKQQWGMKPGDWYVCLHMRDAAHYGETEGVGQTHRNAGIAGYLETIRYVTSRGGWIVKLGGRDSAKLPNMEHVVDYGRGTFKSSLIDLYLIRNCRFFIGTTSGLTNIAVSFGVPCALVNCITTDAQLWNSRVRFAMKPVTDRFGRLLTQAEITSTPWRWRMFSAEVLLQQGAKALENSSDEILETVKQVECLAEGSEERYTATVPDAQELHERWRNSITLPHYYGGALPSLYYLKKYAAKWLPKTETRPLPASDGEAPRLDLARQLDA